MKIGLLGGTFNPPHLGHVLIAQQVLDFTDCEEIWFVPNYFQNPPKPAASPEDRLAMTKMIVEPKTRVCTIEMDRKLNGQTINLLPYLPPENEYRFIIGSDQLSTFHLWGNWEELLRQMPFLVFPRYGYPNDPLYPGMTVISDPSIVATNISSTKIRDRISRGLSIEEFVPPGVASYILSHRMYRV